MKGSQAKFKVAAVVAAVSACDSGEVVAPPVVPASLSVAPDSAALTYIGETVQFTATVRGGTGTAGAVRWASTDEAVVTVDGGGLVTARGNGTAEVRASAGDLSDAAAVVVAQRVAALRAFGGGQRELAGLRLPGSVGVTVRDAGGRPVAGTEVSFTVTAGGGSVDPGSAGSDGSGVASSVWTLGAVPGEQRLLASVAGGPEAEIGATAVDPDSVVSRVVLWSGGGQWGVVGQPLAEPVAVQALDEAGRPVLGALVRFVPGGGGGSADPGSARSDSLGLARAVWTLGAVPGEQRLLASVAGGPEAEIGATAVDPDSVVSRVVLWSGGGQWGVVGQPLAEPVAVQALDEAGRPVLGALVRFVPGGGGGSADPGSARSDSLGLARAVWTLGTAEGGQTLAVSVAGVVRLEVAATAVDPDSVVSRVVLRSGGGQWGVVGQPLAEPVVVQALDEAGRPVLGALVRFVPGGGGGSADPGSARSDSLGLARAVWTLGAVPGEQRLLASVAGGPEAEIGATAVDPDSVVSRVVLWSGGGQWGVVGQPLAEPVAVQALDEAGRPVLGALVRFVPGGGGGSADPGSVRSDSLGLARAVWTLGTAEGGQTLAVSVAGVVRLEVAATAVDPDSVVSRVVLWSGGGQWGVVGQPLAEPVAVQALDEAGRPVLGALVRFVPGGGGGSADPGSARSDSLGLARAVWTLGTAEGGQTLAVSAASVARLEVTATAQPDAGVCGRTRAVVEELLRTTGVADCADVTEEHLSSVWRLDLSSKSITSLRSGDFAGLPGLQRVDLSNNRLRVLPPDILAGLDSLTRLYLGGNQLESLPPGTLAGLPRLTQFYLSSNRLREIPPGLAGLTRLTTLRLGWNPLAELPADLFAGMSRLETLGLGGLGLEELPPGIFAGLSRLEDLVLWTNRLTELPPGIFNDLTSLTDLWLSNNRLTELPPGVFANLDALESIDLSENGLDRLDEATFAGLSSLERLRLDENALTELPPGIFNGLTSLEALWLERNRLSALPPDVLGHLSRLDYLNLSRNRLATLPAGLFAGLEALTKLRLQINGLSALPPGIFGDLESLADLDLSVNALAELPPGVFRGLSKLEELRLGYNPGAPFPVALELARTDAADALARGPASVVLRVPMGGPLSLDVPVTIQGGSASAGSLTVSAGDTASAPMEVMRASRGSGPVHVSLGLPPAFPLEFTGLEARAGEQLVLFAPSENRTPVVSARVPLHWLEAGVGSAEVDLGAYFSDPDGDTLVHEAGSSDAGVVDARVDGGALVLEPLSEGSAVVEVTAADPGGLRAALAVPVTVAPAPDPEGYQIELIFGDGFTEAEEADIRRAAARWMEMITGDVPDVPIDRAGFCRVDLQRVRTVGRIDDVVIGVFVQEENVARLASAASCVVRESGLPAMGHVRFNRSYFGPDSPLDMYHVMLHEIGHVLGIGGIAWRDMLREPWLGDVPRDPHFTGPLAVEAFNEAGGWAYAGGKVPVENHRPWGPNVHWRWSVLGDEVMTAGGTAVSAITLQALADLGYEVDVSRADPYELPVLDKGSVADAAGPESEALLGDDVLKGPVFVVDENGNVVRVIRN
ncbi:leucine-rich repeat domain-containing protein [Candidatus Palauibacter sp.]|uniref:leucine-rich repeat domain-containing protein n=1 Tax=Candidatus Palauibacter sp. TaxID=3101350 RepID=UPI003B0256AB